MAVFEDVQQSMPSVVLILFGYVSGSERQLQRRLAQAAVSKGSGVTPPLTPVGHSPGQLGGTITLNHHHHFWLSCVVVSSGCTVAPHKPLFRPYNSLV